MKNLKKIDLKKLALLGIAGGALMASELPAEQVEHTEQGTFLAGGCGGGGCGGGALHRNNKTGGGKVQYYNPNSNNNGNDNDTNNNNGTGAGSNIKENDQTAYQPMHSCGGAPQYYQNPNQNFAPSYGCGGGGAPQGNQGYYQDQRFQNNPYQGNNNGYYQGPNNNYIRHN